MALTRILQAVPSSTEVQSARTVRTVAAATQTYTKSKEIRITFDGGYRIRFDLKSNGTSALLGQIYRNGSAIGTERSTIATTLVSYIEDIGGWEKDDLCQVYVKHLSGGGAGEVSGFVIGAEYAYVPPPIPAGKVDTDTNV
mgnify:CR=1 FL=1